jgi:hypothetical protein
MQLLKVRFAATDSEPTRFVHFFWPFCCPYQQHWKIPHPVLVCAYTNAAVDNLAMGLADKGLRTLRFGVSSRIHDDLNDLTMEHHMSSHPLAPAFDACVRRLVALDSERAFDVKGQGGEAKQREGEYKSQGHYAANDLCGGPPCRAS